MSSGVSGLKGCCTQHSFRGKLVKSDSLTKGYRVFYMFPSITH